MKPITLIGKLSLVALLPLVVLAGGCGGSNDGPPPPLAGNPEVAGGGLALPGDTEFPDVLGLESCDADPDTKSMGGIWVGIRLGHAPVGSDGQTRLLIAETGEFQLMTDYGLSRIIGVFQTNGISFSATDAVWTWIDALTYGPAEFGVYDLWGGLDGNGRLVLQYRRNSVPPSVETGTFIFAPCDSVYGRTSSLAILAGAYTNSSASYSLHIDEQGAIFYQDSGSSCVGNGSAALIDSAFNMYRVSVQLANCDVFPYGLFETITLTGLGYLVDSGGSASGDVVEFALDAANGRRHLFWSVVARK